MVNKQNNLFDANIDPALLCQQYLNILYHDIRISDKKRKIAETYGEILYPSINKLLTYVKLTENDVFIDLGSGLGKVVIQVFLQTSVKESCGIEIIPELHAESVSVMKKVQQDCAKFYAGGRELKLLLGDFLAMPLTRATVVLLGSPCFTPSVMQKVGKRINQVPNIHSVFSLKPILNLDLPFKKAIRIECSWDSALCYLYSRIC